jgi:small neutral amino acid transporter SnatA (MarC family)
MTELPWGAMFGLLFMTMGPIRALAVFSRVGESDHSPGVRSLAFRSSGLVAAAFVLTVLIGNAVLENWGVGFSTLVAAGGLVLVSLSLQALLFPASGAADPKLDPTEAQASAIAFPGLFPPIAVSVPLIFSVPFPGWETKLGILAMGLGLIAVNLLLMLHSKAILGAVGLVPLQLFGAVFGVLQLALGLQFIADAWAMR